MIIPSKSYKNVHYEFRPGKQVERRMLLETFIKLTEIGFPIAEYQYTGFGSIYFIDFILFHKYLGMDNLISVEGDQEIKKRVHYNNPFGLVGIQMEDILDYIPHLSRDLRHLLWLDFDKILSNEMINAVVMSSARLSAGSIMLITVDVEPPGDESSGPKKWKEYFMDEAKEFLWAKPKKSEFSRSKLLEINYEIFNKAILKGLEGRKEIEFIPLFKFHYADGHKMLSFGGIFCDNSDKRKLKALNWDKLYFLRQNISDEPFDIKVPKITRKERLYLDSAMPCEEGWLPSDFELSMEEVQQYRSIYKFYPSYSELLL